MSKTAHSEFTRLDGLRAALRTRFEKYAAYTHPRLFLPNGLDELTTEMAHDYQSVGAMASNHITNRLMLTMFAPSRPFMRMALDADAMAEVTSVLGIEEEQVDSLLAAGERKASRELDSIEGARALLFDVLLNLVVLGNFLLYAPKGDELVGYNARDYVIRRTARGGIQQLIVRENVLFDELEPEAQAAYTAAKGTATPDAKVCVYHWIQRVGKKLVETTWINEVKLTGKGYDGLYELDDCPWLPLVWNLRPRGHYGTGLVEDFAGDFASLSMMSKAEVEAAILASEFRWLLKPGAATQPREFEESENGAVLAGEDGDLTLVSHGGQTDLRTIREIADTYVRRIGQGFLLGTAITRDAERVTAEEIRQQAVELETGLGGVYTRLASSLQRKIAVWLLHRIDFKLGKTKVQLSIVTGLDALSRNGDLAALRGALTDLAQLQTLTQSPFAAELNWRAILQDVFHGNGCDAQKYLATPEQKQAATAEAQAQEAASMGAEAAARNMTQGNA